MDTLTGKRHVASVGVVGHHQVLIGLIGSVKSQAAFESSLSGSPSNDTDIQLRHKAAMVTKLRYSEEMMLQ